jgi:competence protein ComEA
LAAAILAIATAVVAWIGWSSLRGGPETVVLAPGEPRQVTLPMSPSAPGTTTVTGADALAASPGGADPSAQTAKPPAAIRVHVVGAVRHSAVYTLPPGARVIDAVAKAGGARPDADQEAINLADFVRDGEQIYIPSRRTARLARTLPSPDRTSPARAPSVAPAVPRVPPRSAVAPTRTQGRYPGASPAAPGAPAGSAPAAGGSVNINTASAEELDTLPGVGPVTAAEILAYRREHGPFQHPEDLLNVRGIGEKKLERMRPRITLR